MTKLRLDSDEPVSYERLLDMLSKAHAELVSLCNGKRFRMTVPVQDDDTDIVISSALRHAEAFVKATREGR